MWIVITGNPVDGFTHYGPYTTSGEAIEAGEQSGGDWWIATLYLHEQLMGAR